MSEHIIEFPEDEVIEVLFDDVIVSREGEPPSGTISITENGLINVSQFATADVNVPQGVFPTGTLNVTENGTVNVRNYENANINVPQGVFPTGTLNVTENGTFDVTNYQYILVNIPTSDLRYKHLSGVVFTSSNNSASGSGSLDITLSNGVARIDFDIMINSSGSDDAVFTYGIDTNAIALLDNTLPAITPIEGGHWIYSSSSPSINYGSAFEPHNSRYWSCARYYDLSDLTQIGSWPVSQFTSGTRLHGVCFGTYEI